MPEIPLSRRRLAVLIGLLVGLLALAGRYLLRPAEVPSAAAPPPLPAETVAADVVVHVVGAVHRPGLYRLPQGTRIADALRRAGGAKRRADLALINLAAPLADGEQVVVPARGASPADGGGGSASAGAPTTGPVHLNTATLEQLDALPGVGPVTAQKILDYREQHGAFASADELDAVPGIGPARLDELRDLVAP